MTRIETAEQGRIWLSTYEVSLVKMRPDLAMVAADGAVEAWLARVGSSDRPRAEEELHKKLVSAERDRDAYMQRLAGAETACADLRRLRDDALSRLHERNREVELLRGQRDAARTLAHSRELVIRSAWGAFDQPSASSIETGIEALVAERNSLREDLAAMRLALGVHNNPNRSVAECVKVVGKRMDMLVERLAVISESWHEQARALGHGDHGDDYRVCPAHWCGEDRKLLNPPGRATDAESKKP